MDIHILTIFPDMFTGFVSESIIKRSIESNKAEITIHNLRDWTEDERKTVDDRPFGGGAGMVMMVEPIYKAISEIKENYLRDKKYKIVLTSAKGSKYTQAKAHEYSELEALLIICGHYEGVDERVAEYLIDEEISIGNYILTGGELPAMIVSDSVIRLLPGVLGNEESIIHESFSDGDNKEYPHYTRPAEFTTEQGESWKVPDVLLSGNHAKIEQWRQDNSQ